jgi:hypothetical protein
MKSYVIQWKSRINGRAGKGTKVFGYEEAALLAEELNQEYPGIHHEVIAATPPSEVNRMQASAEESSEPRQPQPAEAEATSEGASVKKSPDLVFSA